RFTVTAPTVTIGPYTYRDVSFMIAPSRTDIDPSTSGTVGSDILRNFDLDFDFANKKFNLFSPEHCVGQVVYWTSGGAARIPFRFDTQHRIQFTMKLDGKDVDAVLDTGNPVSHLSKPIASRLFDVDETSQGTEPGDDGGKPGFHHRFSTLTVGGVTV